MSGLTKLLIAAAFLNGLSWIVLIPIWQYPDEQSHFAQVQDIAELKNNPKTGFNTSLEIATAERLLGTERDGLGNNQFTYQPYYHIDYSNTKDGLYENFISNLPKDSRTSMVKWEATQNPPLYHIMASNFYRLTTRNNLFTRVYAIRIFSLLIYLALILILTNASKLIFAKEKEAQTILPGIIAFTPMLVFSTTGVLPDPLTIFLFTAIFTVCLHLIRTKISLSHIILLAVLNTLGIFTRQQFEIAMPISLLAVIYGLYQLTPKSKKLAFWAGLFLLAAISVVSIKIHPGILTFPEIGIPNLALIFTSQFVSYLVSSLKHYYSQTLPWYWGVYKWLSFTMPHIYYQVINRIIVLALFGLLIFAVKIIKNRKLTKTALLLIFLIISCFLYFAIFLLWDFYFQKQYGYSFGVQGRYFLPFVLPLSAILFFGLRELFKIFLKNNLPYFYFTIAFIMIIFNDASLAYVSSTYYFTSNIHVFINQASQYKPEIFKGNTIIILICLALLLQVLYLYKLLRYSFSANESN